MIGRRRLCRHIHSGERCVDTNAIKSPAEQIVELAKSVPMAASNALEIRAVLRCLPLISAERFQKRPSSSLEVPDSLLTRSGILFTFRWLSLAWYYRAAPHRQKLIYPAITDARAILDSDELREISSKSNYELFASMGHTIFRSVKLPVGTKLDAVGHDAIMSPQTEVTKSLAGNYINRKSRRARMPLDTYVETCEMYIDQIVNHRKRQRADCTLTDAVLADLEMLAAERYGWRELIREPLWLSGEPSWSGALWKMQQADLKSHSEDWEVWFDWYSLRLTGALGGRELEFAYLDSRIESPVQEPSLINSAIRSKLEIAYRQPGGNDAKLTERPDPRAASIEPQWIRGHLRLVPEMEVLSFNEGDFAGALNVLREETAHLATSLQTTQCDPRFIRILEQKLLPALNKNARSKADLFQIAHFYRFLSEYQKTAELEWDPISSASYRALLILYGRCVRRFPAWDEFEEIVRREPMTEEAIAEAPLIVGSFSKVLRDYPEVVDVEISESLDKLNDLMVLSDEHIEFSSTTAQSIAKDAMESLSNILKRLTEISTTLQGEVGRRLSLLSDLVDKVAEAFTKSAKKSLIDEAARLGTRFGPNLTKWGRRAVWLSGAAVTGTTIGPAFLSWLATSYPGSLGWLTHFIALL